MNHPIKVKYVVAALVCWLAWIAWTDHQALKLAITHIDQLHEAVQSMFQK